MSFVVDYDLFDNASMEQFGLFFCRYKSKDRDATMSILDIGLLTGFTVDTDDLELVGAELNTQTHINQVVTSLFKLREQGCVFN